MGTKRLYGKDGELFFSLVYKNVKIAEAERFIATLFEETVPVSRAPGSYEITTGCRATLRADDVTVTDNEAAKAVLDDLKNGVVPVFAFQGRFKNNSGYAEKIIFRDCVLAGTLDCIGFAKGFIMDMEFRINNMAEEQVNLFTLHGR